LDLRKQREEGLKRPFGSEELEQNKETHLNDSTGLAMGSSSECKYSPLLFLLNPANISKLLDILRKELQKHSSEPSVCSAQKGSGMTVPLEVEPCPSKCVHIMGFSFLVGLARPGGASTKYNAAEDIASLIFVPLVITRDTLRASEERVFSDNLTVFLRGKIKITKIMPYFPFINRSSGFLFSYMAARIHQSDSNSEFSMKYTALTQRSFCIFKDKKPLEVWAASCQDSRVPSQ
jgi:hypothetical protein